MAIPLLAAALAGLAKSELIDRPKYESQVKSRAISARFAPLQGRATPSFSDLQAPDAAQTALDFGLSAAAFNMANPAEAGKVAGAAPAASMSQQPMANFGGPVAPGQAPIDFSASANSMGGVQTQPNMITPFSQEQMMAQQQPSSLSARFFPQLTALQHGGR